MSFVLEAQNIRMKGKMDIPMATQTSFLSSREGGTSAVVVALAVAGALNSVTMGVVVPPSVTIAVLTT
ncbi:hypothetical protein HAX54_042930, partial [Datura stramonium]|nr:hypothetical protein [Datura stramonium]